MQGIFQTNGDAEAADCYAVGGVPGLVYCMIHQKMFRQFNMLNMGVGCFSKGYRAIGVPVYTQIHI